MKRIISNIIFIIYFIIAIFVTVCLLSYNDYKVTVFGNTSLIVVEDNKMQPDYNKGDLIIVENSEEVSVGEKIFFYNVYNEQIKVRIGTITNIENKGKEKICTIDDGEHTISSEFVIGATANASSTPKIGTVLGILESKWGFLFLIVLPALLAFVNQVMVIISGIKESKGHEKNEQAEK